MIRACACFPLVVGLTLLGTFTFAQPVKKPAPPKPRPPVAAAFRDVEVSLNGKTQTALIHILDFGDIAAGQAQTATISLRNTSNRPLTLDMFAWGDYLKAAWHDTDQPVFTRRIVPPNAEASIDLEFSCADITKQRLQLISLAENSVPVTTVVVAYVAHPATVVLPVVTASYQSGLGTKWSNYYTVPSGPAPYGYTYVSDSFDTAGSDPAGNGRNCGFNVDCKKIKADDSDVVWQFKIQGYEHDWTHSDSSVKAQGILTVVYRLKPPPATVLKTIETK